MKKDLRKLAKKDHKKILDDNKTFYEKITTENYSLTKNSESKNKFSWKKFSFAMAAVLLVIVISATMLVIFLPDNTSEEEKKYYAEENFLTDIVEYENIENNLKYFHVDKNIIDTIFLTYDSLSGDYLFYDIFGAREDYMEDWKITICVNKDYAFPYIEEWYTQSTIINEYEVKYYTKNYIEEGVFVSITKSLIKIKEETILIEYTCLNFEHEENNFFDWLGNTITKK